jgi:hypothetical protein
MTLCGLRWPIAISSAVNTSSVLRMRLHRPLQPDRAEAASNQAARPLPAPRRRRTVAGHPPAHRRPSHLRLTAHHRARLNRARNASGVETRQPQACLPPHAPGAPAAAAHVVLRLMRAHEGQRYCLGVQPALVVRCAGGRLLERRGGPHPSRSTPATERSSPGTLRPAGSAARWCVT